MDESSPKGSAPPAEKSAASSAEGSAAGGAGAVALDRYQIFPGRPMAAFNTPSAKAYVAEDTKGARGGLIALVSPGRAPLRTEILSSLRSTECPYIMRPYRWGAIDWPGGEQRFVVIYAQPGEGPFVPSLAGPYPALTEAMIVERVIRPVAAALSDLKARGIPHRALRPDNLYFGFTEGSPAVLGDAAMAPAGSTSPIMFETIENGMANPLGRGPGSFEDDLYAFGVTLVCLALGQNPIADPDDHGLIYTKIEKGSYAAIAGNARLPPALREVIRGLLADDPKERWTLNDLGLWLDGRRLSPIQPKTASMAKRPFVCATREHFTCRSLAYTMAEHWSEAPKALAEGDLEGWVRKSVGDTETANDVLAAFAWGARPSVGAGGSAEAAMVARLCIALDPKGPLRFKTIAATMQGLGPMLNELMRDPNGVQPFAQLITSDLATLWIDKQFGDGLEGRAQVALVDRLRAYIKQHGPGYGPERCLYDLNPTLPCLSSLVASRYVTTPEELLNELETLAVQGSTDQFPVDRHIAAFIAARFGKGTEDHFLLIGDRSDKGKAALGALRALAVLQWKLGVQRLPGLTAWMGKLAKPIIDDYHSASYRAKLHEQLSKVTRTGSLSELLNLVDDAQLRARDDESYRVAVKQCNALDASIDRLVASPGRDADAVGAKLAAGISMAVAAGTTAIVGLMAFL